MLDEHPVVRWVAVIALVAGIGGGAYSVVEIHKDLDTVITMLRDIQDDQADATRLSDTRFDTRGDEHRDIARIINHINGVLSVTPHIGAKSD